MCTFWKSSCFFLENLQLGLCKSFLLCYISMRERMICEFKSLAKSNNKVPKQKINYSMADENVKLRSMKFRLGSYLLSSIFWFFFSNVQDVSYISLLIPSIVIFIISFTMWLNIFKSFCKSKIKSFFLHIFKIKEKFPVTFIIFLTIILLPYSSF